MKYSAWCFSKVGINVFLFLFRLFVCWGTHKKLVSNKRHACTTSLGKGKMEVTKFSFLLERMKFTIVWWYALSSPIIQLLPSWQHYDWIASLLPHLSSQVLLCHVPVATTAVKSLVPHCNGVRRYHVSPLRCTRTWKPKIVCGTWWLFPSLQLDYDVE